MSRNSLWADRIAFLSAETRLTPNKQRVWTSLGVELMRKGRFAEALKVMQHAKLIGQLVDQGNFHSTTLLNMVFALHYNGQQQQALIEAQKIPVTQLDDDDRSAYHEVLGRIYLSLGDFEQARVNLKLAVRYADNPNAAKFLQSF